MADQDGQEENANEPDVTKDDAREDVQVEEANPTTSEPASSSAKRKAEWFDIEDEKNTYVYVKGLPRNITEEEFLELMKIGGVIAKKNIQGCPYNIKLYRDKDGALKGDALCRYVRKESVDQAILLIDGRQYDDKHTLQCERAKFELKGSYDPSKKPRVDPRAKLKQKKVADKILSWEPTKEELLGARQKKVILKNMFTLEELAEDASLMIDLKDDVEARCSELIGEPKRVDIYDKHPEGVVAVTFSEPEQAAACVEALNNQFYAGRVVTAELWDGKTNYKIKETREETEERLEKFKESIAQ